MIKFVIATLMMFYITACASSLSPVTIPSSEPKSTYLQKVHPNVVLVLGSGGARGFAHAGVLKALEENHIPIDMIVGTSSGSIVGALYASYPSATTLEQLFLTTPRSQVIQFSLTKIFSGPFSGNVLQRYLIAHIKATSFDQLAIPFVAVATNLRTGKVHAFSSGPIAPAVNASSAAPPFFQPVELYGETYIDGGLVDPVAVDVARKFHPKMIIAVNLAPQLSANVPGVNPQVFLRSMGIMLSRLTQYSAQRADVIIHPDMEDIDIFEGAGREKSIKAGFDTAMNQMPAIKKLLDKNHISLR